MFCHHLTLKFLDLLVGPQVLMRAGFVVFLSFSALLLLT